MKTIGLFGKAAFILLALGTIGAFTPASAEASERVVVRTERHWVAPRYETRYYNGFRQNVIVRDGYWVDTPVYADVGTYYSTPDYYYSYPSYYYGGYPYYYRGYWPGVSLGFRFGGGHRHWR